MKIYDIYLSFISEPNRRDELFAEMVMALNPMIKRNTYLICKDIREDFSQDLLMKIYNLMINEKFKLNIFKGNIIKQYEDLECLFEEDKLLIDKFINFSDENKIYYTYMNSKENFELFYTSFSTFVGNMKLINFFNKSICNFRIDYLRRESRNRKISLELKPIIEMDKILSNHDNFKKDLLTEINCILTNREQDIYNLLYEQKVPYSQKDIAKILKVKPQYISKTIKNVNEKLEIYKKN